GNRIVLFIPCLREIIRTKSLSNDLLEAICSVRLHDNPKILHGLDSPQPHTTSLREAKAWRGCKRERACMNSRDFPLLAGRSQVKIPPLQSSRDSGVLQGGPSSGNEA